MNLELNRLLTTMRDQQLHLPLTIGEPMANYQASVTVQDLLEGDTLLIHIKRLAEQKQTTDLQAAASLFQKRIASLLLGSILTPLTRAGVGLLPDTTTTAVLLHDDHPAQIQLNGIQSPAVLPDRLQTAYPDFENAGWETVDSEEALQQTVFQKLFDETLGPLSLRINQLTGLSLRILWGNIGNYCSYFFDQLRHDPQLSEQAQRDETALMNSVSYESCPITQTSELRYIEDATPPRWARVRSSCCLWCHLSNGDYCITCPRLTHEKRVEQLNQMAHS